MKKFLAFIIVLAIAFGGGYAVCKYLDGRPDGVVADPTIIAQEIIEISELATVSKTYTFDVPYEGEAIDLFKKPEKFLNEYGIKIFSKELTVEYTGTVKCGPDMSNFTKRDLVFDKQKNSVTVELPKSEVLSHEIDEDSWTIVNQRRGLFNPLTPKDDSDLRKYAKKEALKKLDMNDLLKQADTNAVVQITNLLELACPGMDVIVTVK